MSRERAKNIMRLVQACLSDDLLKPYYRARKTPDSDPTEGHCYVASEALFFLLGGKEAGYHPMHMKIAEDGETFPHWFLQHESGFRLDPTVAQYKGRTPDYDQARSRTFQPVIRDGRRVPSRSAAKLIGLVKERMREQ